MTELVSLLRNSGEAVRVVLKSIGSCHCPVAADLSENGISVFIVNSLRIKRLCSQSIRKVKADRIISTQFVITEAIRAFYTTEASSDTVSAQVRALAKTLPEHSLVRKMSCITGRPGKLPRFCYGKSADLCRSLSAIE